MPQFDLANFTPQLVWLALFFAILYFGVVSLTLPKLGRVMTAREDQVTGDIATAETAKAEADRMAADYDASVVAAQDSARAKLGVARATAVKTLEERLAASIAPRRFMTWLLGLFAAVALLMASIGIYGVMSYSVTERTHEIGVRRALGAQDRNVLALIVRRGMILTLIGAAIGLAASIALSRVLSNLLFGVSAIDPFTLTVVAVLLIAVALVACFQPARRATKVDPMVALRHE